MARASVGTGSRQGGDRDRSTVEASKVEAIHAAHHRSSPSRSGSDHEPLAARADHAQLGSWRGCSRLGPEAGWLGTPARRRRSRPSARASRRVMTPADGRTVQRSTDGVASAGAASRSLARVEGTRLRVAPVIGLPARAKEERCSAKGMRGRHGASRSPLQAGPEPSRSPELRSWLAGEACMGRGTAVQPSRSSREAYPVPVPSDVRPAGVRRMVRMVCGTMVLLGAWREHQAS